MEQKKKYMLLGVIGVLLLLIGVSYAYWRLTLTQTETNEIASSCFDIILTNEQNEINLQKAAPISDEEGMSLTPYTFTIKNNCDTYASYTINLELLNTVLENNRLSAAFVKAMIDEESPFLLNTTPATTTLDNAYEAYTLTTGYLDANEERSYSLRLWMDSDVTIEDDAMNKQLESKITITASYIDHIPTDYDRCVEEYGEDSIQCSIIAQVDTTGTCPAVNEDGTVNLTSEEETNGYICSAPDDYGTSHYFRGNVTNNYVKFAGYYWRILRINGDESIRMIYAGDADVIDALENKEEVLANGYDDGDTDYTQIGMSEYNSRMDNNAYVGYMYGENYWGEPITSDTTSSKTLNSYYYYYADSYTFDTSTGTYTLESPTKAIWNKSLVGKYTCLDNEDTSCSTLYYIDSYINTYSCYTLSYTSTNTGGVYTENHGASQSYRRMSSSYYYGTGYTFNKSTGYFELIGIGYNETGYDGSQVGTYICESASKSCNELYYIESTGDATTANVKTISRTGTTYEETHANINNSTIKTKVDTWYEENIKGTEYEQYISDTLFCNDRSFASDNSGTGTGYSYTLYRVAYQRTGGATLKCVHQNDRFTVKDENVGNGSLTYPVGLLSSDEVYLAGGSSYDNNYYYLYTGNSYWTMSPHYFSGAKGRYVNYYGGSNSFYVDESYGVRPVINLKPNSLKSGDGTALNPYTVEEDI